MGITKQQTMISKFMSDHVNTMQSLISQIGLIVHIGDVIIDLLSRDKKILICGNGGSAADAQHFAAELIVKFEKKRSSIPAVALTTDTSILTAIGNDFGFDEIFSRQIEALGNEDDILIALSTSGNSQNIIRAIDAANDRRMCIITLLGNFGGLISGSTNMELIVNSQNTARIQETHIFILHCWCAMIESELFGG